jgi:hypothetical protein
MDALMGEAAHSIPDIKNMRIPGRSVHAGVSAVSAVGGRALQQPGEPRAAVHQR